MAESTNNSMACAEFEGLLSNALDGSLTGMQLQNFEAHSRSCVVCGPMLQDAEAGQRFLKSLQSVEPPADLVRNILAVTSGLRNEPAGAASRSQNGWEWMTGIIPSFACIMRQPRVVMSFGMAFFAFSICLSLAGVKLSDLNTADLRPSAIKRNYYETSGRVVKYYENLRLVYEMESRAQELKRVIAPAVPAGQQEKESRAQERYQRSSQTE